MTTTKTTKTTCLALLLATAAAASAGTCAKCTWGSGPCIDANGACSPYTCAVALNPDGSCPRGSATNVCSCKTSYCDQSSDDGNDACCGNGCPTHRAVATKATPKDCMDLGSLTNCTKLHAHSYCGTSSNPAARFTDGTGCSCSYGYSVKDGNCTSQGPSPPGPAPGPSPKDCTKIGSLTKCSLIHPNSFCGASPNAAARFADGTGCSCNFGFVVKDGSCAAASDASDQRVGVNHTLTLSSTSYDQRYDSKSASMNTVACSDGSHGLAAKYPTFGSLPSFPRIGGVSAIAGWNSASCGTCWKLTYKGNSINVLAIDHAADGNNLSLEAMNMLTDGQAVQLGRIEATAEKVSAAEC